MDTPQVIGKFLPITPAMRLVTFRHDGRGFTVPWLPALDSEQTLVLAFAGANRRGDVDPRAGPMRELRRAYPRSHFLVGAADAAAAADASDSSLGGAEDSIAIAVACFEWTTLRSTSLDLRESRLRRGDLHAAGAELARKLVAPGLRGVLLLAEAGRSRGRELASGLDGALPARAAVSGLLTASVAATAPRAAVIGFYGEELHFRHSPRETSAQLVTTIGEGGEARADVWGDLLAVVSGAESAALPELPAAAQTIALLAKATFARAASTPVPTLIAALD